MNKEQNPLDDKFLTSGQAQVKLDIALKRYFQILREEENRDLRKRYGSYLSVRLRPAAEQLIQEGENEKLMILLRENKLSPAMLEGFLSKACSCKNREAQIQLLRLKNELYGFSVDSWEL